MIFWIFFISFLLICFGPFNIGGIRYKTLMKYLGCAFLIFITIMRFDVGYDYAEYYHSIYPSIDYSEFDRVEPANKLIYEYVAQQNFPPLLFIIYGLITLGLFIYSFTKYTPNFGITIFVYLAFFYLGGLSTIRQEIAVSITFFAYKFIRSKNLLSYIISCIIAVLFHDTAFVALIIYPFLRIKNYNLSILISIASIAVLCLFMQVLVNLPLFSPFYYYIMNADAFKGGGITKFVYLFLSIFIFFLSFRNHNATLINMSLLCIIGATLMFLLGGHVGGRIAEYYMIYMCIIIPTILFKYYKKYIITSFCSLSLWFIAGIYITMQIPQKSPNTPYKTIFTEDLKKPRFK